MTEFLHAIRVRPRTAIFFMVAAVAPFVVPARYQSATRFLVGWNIAVTLYLASVWAMMLRDSVEGMRRRADDQDVGALAALLLTVAAAVASLFGIAAELSNAKELPSHARLAHVALAGSTVFLSWFLVHTVFALHYAHDYYIQTRRTTPPLMFPDKTLRPHYWDFLYFSFVIGAATATADVSIASSGIRRVAMAHSILSFFFNTTILALAINVGASLL